MGQGENCGSQGDELGVSWSQSRGNGKGCGFKSGQLARVAGQRLTRCGVGETEESSGFSSWHD